MKAKWNIGDRIQGRWEIHNIFRGGMGVVYIVYDHEFREPFAVKTFRDDIFAQNPAIAARFEQEALAWVSLDIHYNVVQARFVLTIEGTPFLFLEYVTGGDLSGWIGTPRLTKDLPQALRFAIQFCDGMTHALSKGIKAHRDIKPQNCLITDDSTLKVTDFGLAKVFDDARIGHYDPSGDTDIRTARVSERALTIGMSRTGTAAGTVTHMAPEQFDDAKHVDVRADIYSFGVMLFQMVTGRLPFEGRTWEEFERKHKTRRPPSLPRRIPREISSMIETCLEKDPSRRSASFTSVRDRLSRVYETLTGEPAPQPVAGPQLDAVQLSNKGASLGNLGRYEEATACYNRAIEINPRLPAAWTNKGVALGDMGRFKEAIPCYDRAIEINPHDAVTWYNKGVALENLGRSEEAIACFDRAIEINPRHAGVWYNKGAALWNLGRFEEAIACCDRAIDINPRLAMAWSNKGLALANLGRIREAIACYDRAIEINPRFAMAWSNKGLALAYLERIQEAIACYDRAIEINARFAVPWSNRSQALLNLGEFEDAIASCDRAIEVNPRLGAAWYNKGLGLQALDRIREALACFEKADRLGIPQATSAIKTCRKALGR